VLWIVWGWHDGVYALIALQLALGALNIRGVLKTRLAHTLSGIHLVWRGRKVHNRPRGMPHPWWQDPFSVRGRRIAWQAPLHFGVRFVYDTAQSSSMYRHMMRVIRW